MRSDCKTLTSTNRVTRKRLVTITKHLAGVNQLRLQNRLRGQKPSEPSRSRGNHTWWDYGISQIKVQLRNKVWCEYKISHGTEASHDAKTSRKDNQGAITNQVTTARFASSVKKQGGLKSKIQTPKDKTKTEYASFNMPFEHIFLECVVSQSAMVELSGRPCVIKWLGQPQFLLWSTLILSSQPCASTNPFSSSCIPNK